MVGYLAEFLFCVTCVRHTVYRIVFAVYTGVNRDKAALMSNMDQSNQNWLTVLSKARTAVVFDLTGTYTSHGWNIAYRSRRHFAPTVVCLRSRMGCRVLVDRSTPRSYRTDAIGRKLSRRDVDFKNTTTRRVMLSLRKRTRI